jgi:uncharacterized protein YbjT (DUF2867 family)
MKILVTGATGFIGAAIARKLSQQRHEILALSRSDSAAAKLRRRDRQLFDLAAQAAMLAVWRPAPLWRPRTARGSGTRSL